MIFRYPDDLKTKIILGKLIAADTSLPDKLTEVRLPAQQYALVSLSSLTQLHQDGVNRLIEQTGSLKRSRRAPIF